MQNTATQVDEMNKKYDALMRTIEEIQTGIAQGLADGPAAAQSARLVALALSKQAYSMLENITGSLQSMRGPTADGAVEDSHPLKELVSIAEEVMEELQEEYGVQKEAIAPFMYETTVVILPIVDSLVAKAQEKYLEAYELTREARSLAW